MEHVGLILGIEMSRLGRCNEDWQHLLKMCSIFGTLLGAGKALQQERTGIAMVAPPSNPFLTKWLWLANRDIEAQAGGAAKPLLPRCDVCPLHPRCASKVKT
jgi:hypothetical protein